MAEPVFKEASDRIISASPTNIAPTDNELDEIRNLWSEDYWHNYRDHATTHEVAADCDDYYDDDDHYDESCGDSDAENDRWHEAKRERDRYDELTRDWSKTNRGSHVEFASTENIPLKEGRQNQQCESVF